MYSAQPLYKKSNRSGKIRQWQINVDGTKDSCQIVIRHGVTGGRITEKREEILPNKRYKNAIVRAEALSTTRYDKKLRDGYDPDKLAAENIEYIQKPMLPKRLDDHLLDTVKLPVYTEEKLNGVHGFFICKTGELMSRKLKPFDVEHIRADLEKMALDNPLFDIIGFEFYAPGYSINDIRSMVSNTKNPDRGQLVAYVFDIAHEDLSLETTERKKLLSVAVSLNLGYSINIKRVPYYIVKYYDTLKRLYKEFTGNDREGMILRQPDSVYEYDNESHRTSDFQKVKPIYSREFPIHSIRFKYEIINGEKTPLVEFYIRVSDDPLKTTKVIPNWPVERRAVWYHSPEFPDAESCPPLTVEFRDWTVNGLPEHAKGIDWRNYE